MTNSLDEILLPDLLEQVEKIVFPWPQDAPLDGTDVGRVFFLDPNAHELWNLDEIKGALRALASLKPAPEEIIAAVDLDSWQILLGIILLLDQAPRYLCKKGTDARYIYHFFEVLSLSVIKNTLAECPGWFVLSYWTKTTGLSIDQSIIRILMLLALLVHSEDLSDQQTQLSLAASLREEYELVTKTIDPYRSSFSADLKDIYLLKSLLESGPPQGVGVRVSDFVYWMMRYYTSHVAYLEHFGRSPFRNVAVGREDEEGEGEWLRVNGVVWSEEDEVVRRKVREDGEAGRWTELRL